MNNQEAFDKVVAGARAQGYKLSVVNGTCQYRGDGGTKCHAGHLIADDEYTPWMEYKMFPDLVRAHSADGWWDTGLSRLPASHVPRIILDCVAGAVDTGMIRDLQQIHDDCADYNEGGSGYFESEFQRIAQCYGLVYTPPSP